MSKIYKEYEKLKEKDNNYLYLFLCGNFYIALDSDAIILNEIFDLKLTKFSNICDKCGFPKNSIDKYIEKFNNKNIKFKIIAELKNEDKINKISQILNCEITKMKKEELIDLLNQIKKII